MNAREGMRRVGILLGVLGGIAGGVFGYAELQDVWSSHTRFKRLQALAVMQDVATAIKAYPSPPISIDPQTGERVQSEYTIEPPSRTAPLPPGYKVGKPPRDNDKAQSQPAIDLSAGLVPKAAAPGAVTITPQHVKVGAYPRGCADRVPGAKGRLVHGQLARDR